MVSANQLCTISFMLMIPAFLLSLPSFPLSLLPSLPSSLLSFLPSLLRYIPHNLPNLVGTCNIKRRNSSLSQLEFLEKLVTTCNYNHTTFLTCLLFCFLVRFAYTEPVILTGMSDQSVRNHFQVKQLTSDVILMLFELWFMQNMPIKWL